MAPETEGRAAPWRVQRVGFGRHGPHWARTPLGARLVEEEPTVRLGRLLVATEDLVVAAEARPAGLLDGALDRLAELGVGDDLLRRRRRVVTAAAGAHFANAAETDSNAFSNATELKFVLYLCFPVYNQVEIQLLFLLVSQFAEATFWRFCSGFLLCLRFSF